jgi:competence protein ComEA
MFTLPRPQLAVYVVAALAVAWVATRYVGMPGGAPSRGPTSSRGSGSGSGRTTVKVGAAAQASVVDVSGAVRHPGVYELPPGARVQDAVRRAGGARASADLQAVNLAAKVADGVQIVVPRRGAATASAGAGGAPGAGAGGAPAGPVNLNTATEAQLDSLDGVGPATAQKILAFRQQHGGFSSVAQLDQIPGIGPKKLAALRTKVTV